MDVGELRTFQRQTEERFAASFDAEHDAELNVADHASALLLGVLHAAAPTTTHSVVELDDSDVPVGGDAADVRRYAIVMMGVRGWRAIRASRAVLSVGYEVESRAYERIILELMAHRQAVLDDPHVCAVAIEWIGGRRRYKIGEKVDALGAEGLWGELSHDSHGDPAGAIRLIDPNPGSMLVGPARGLATRACLLLHAGFAHDHAVILAELAGVPLNGADALADQIREAWGKLNDELPPLEES